MNAALSKAMRVFWRKGYAATSMSDIYAATGLKPGSIYAAFKDKEGLFQQVFMHYAEAFRATLPKDRTGLAAISAWIELQARLAADDPERAGCLIINTVAEREAHSVATQAMAQGRMREIRDFFVRHLVIADQARELPAGFDIDMQADALLGAVVSIMTLGRAGADAQTIRHVAEAALQPFDLAVHAKVNA